MKRIIFLFLLSSYGGLFAQNTFFNGSMVLDTATPFIDVTEAISLPDGSVLVAGRSNPNGLSIGSDEAVLYKLDSLGYILWGRKYDPGVNNHFHDMTVTPDNGVILCGYQERSYDWKKDLLLIKLDNNLDLQWSKVYNNDTSLSYIGQTVIPTPDGGYFTAGNANTDLDALFTVGTRTAFYLKVDSLGNVEKAATLQDTINSEILQASLAPDGGVLMTGQRYGGSWSWIPQYLFWMTYKLDSQYEPEWIIQYDSSITKTPVSIIPRADSSYLIGCTAGWEDISGNIQDDGFAILHIDKNGLPLRNKRFGLLNTVEDLMDVYVYPDGSMLFAGKSFDENFGEYAYLTVVRTDSNGNPLWARSYYDSFPWITPRSRPIRIMEKTGNRIAFTGGRGDNIIRYSQNGYLQYDYSFSLHQTDDSLNGTCNDTIFMLDSASVPLPHVSVVPDSILYGASASVHTPTFDTIPVIGSMACLNCEASLPAVSFTMDTGMFCIGDTIHFVNTSNPPSNYVWYVDGVPADSSLDFEIAFSSGGSYHIALAREGQYGCGADMDTVLQIGEPLEAVFFYNTATCAYMFRDTTEFALTSYWDFGDGSMDTLHAGQPVLHTYSSPGSYTVCLISENGCGRDTTCQAVSCSQVVANYSYVNTFPSNDVTFTNQSTNSCAAFWNFGDGTTSTSFSPGTHQYPGPGAYQVCLISENACSSDTLRQTLYIGCTPPGAAFSLSTQSLTLTCQDQSAGSPTAWSWDFGDGGTSTLQNPTHTYALPGNYTVCLITSNSCGVDTFCQNTTLVSLENSLYGAISVSPNPTSGRVMIQGVPSVAGQVKVRVADLYGRTVYRKVLPASDLSLDLGGLAGGYYLIELMLIEEVLRWKVVLRH